MRKVAHRLKRRKKAGKGREACWAPTHRHGTRRPGLGTLGDLAGRVLVRADFNVRSTTPVESPTTPVSAALPTLRFEKGGRWCSFLRASQGAGRRVHARGVIERFMALLGAPVSTLREAPPDVERAGGSVRDRDPLRERPVPPGRDEGGPEPGAAFARSGTSSSGTLRCGSPPTPRSRRGSLLPPPPALLEAGAAPSAVLTRSAAPRHDPRRAKVSDSSR